MAAIRSVDNRTESALRKALHAMGLRYRKHSRTVIGKPDIVFARAKVVVFIDGDYWHGRLLRERGIDAVTSYYTTGQRPYWVAKLQRNVARDDYVTKMLREDGWLVLRYWETDVKRDLGLAAREIRTAVRRRIRMRDKEKAPASRSGTLGRR